ncbi:MAG: hypothetical protein H8E03_00890 [Pelagibacteraceae bacterium]|nr:hypothetical protein [Pelagibacteraceae bacterium]
MLYYLLLEDDTEADVYFSSNILGDESFGVFYPEQGMDVLMELSNIKSQILETLRIKDEQGTSYTLEEFISILGKLKIKRA